MRKEEERKVDHEDMSQFQTQDPHILTTGPVANQNRLKCWI